MTESAELEFHKEMVNIYGKALTECQHNAINLINLIEELGGLGAAKKVLSPDFPQSEIEILWDCQRRDLTVEHLVIKPRFKCLFTESELAEARKRLKDHGFRPANPGSSEK
jgi:hypothetical protein